MKNIIIKCWSFLKVYVKVILITIFFIALTIVLDVLQDKFYYSENVSKCLKYILNLIGFLTGGYLGSYFIAKHVINKDVETKMSELSDTVRRNEKEKRTFLKNLNWIIQDFCLSNASRNKFKTDVERNAYDQGYNDGVEQLQTQYLNKLHFGVIETNEMFTKDWTIKAT